MEEEAAETAGQDEESLEEKTEPLAESVAPVLLEEGTVLEAPQAGRLTIKKLLRQETSENLYGAEGDDGADVWVRERHAEHLGELEKEAEVLRSVEGCPMFLRAMDCFEHDGRAYLVTEAAGTETLADLLVEGEADLRSVVRVLAQAAHGLHALHSAGWVHLALRPESLAFGQPGVRILELARAVRLGSKPDTPFYVVGYSAPEVAAESDVDQRSDVYSVGAILYHAVQGVPLPEGEAGLALWTPGRPLPGVPQVLARCLGERETRYPSAEELHGALRGLEVHHLRPPVRYQLGVATTIGLNPERSLNEDGYACMAVHLGCELMSSAWALAAVADGMGGMDAGEVASRRALETVVEQARSMPVTERLPSPSEQAALVRAGVELANQRVCAAMREVRSKGGTTLTWALLIGRRLAIGHVGDCRAYLVRGNEGTLLTWDHSLAMAFVRQGTLDESEVRSHPDRSKVTRSLGEREAVPDYFVDTLGAKQGQETMELADGDVLVVCSDGLWELVYDKEMTETVCRLSPDLSAAAHRLTELALERGAPDNATVVLVGLNVQAEHREGDTDAESTVEASQSELASP